MIIEVHVARSPDGWKKAPRAGSGIDAISPVRGAASKDSVVEFAAPPSMAEVAELQHALSVVFRGSSEVLVWPNDRMTEGTHSLSAATFRSGRW